MRRILLPLAVLVLGGTLLAQNGTVVTAPRLMMTSTSAHRDGDVMRMKSLRLDFPNGMSLTADEAVANLATGTIDLSGNVRLSGATSPKTAK